MVKNLNMLLRKLVMMALIISVTLAYVPSLSAYAAGGDDEIRTILSGMSTRQKITQCIMIDFRKWNDITGKPADMTVLNDDVAELLADYQLGSVVLFGENVKTTEGTVELTKAMQAAAMSKGGLPMIVAADQEGGSVFRLASGTAMPGNMATAATDDPGNAERVGQVVGREIESVGINTTLAPVIDVNNNPDNPVIGLRSFSDDPEIVAEYGCRYLDGLNKYNVIGCVKHFPGHGDTNTDSHYGLPEVDKSLYKLGKCELIPFQRAIDQGVDMIMTAHILYPQVDSSTIYSELTGKEESRPATMSRIILTNLLRRDMGYRGVVVTDAMNMLGIAQNFTMEQATLEALKAGADMVCMPLTGVYNKEEWISKMESIIGRVEQAVNDDEQFAAQLDESVERILTLKKNKGILDYDASDYTVERAVATVGSKENRSIERDLAARAVTVIRNENNTLPLKVDKDTKILLLTPYANEKAQMVMGVNRAKEAGLVPKDARVWVDVFSINNYKIAGEIEKDLQWADVVIINSEVSNTARLDYSHFTSEAPKLYTDYCSRNGKKSIVMSVDKPYDVQLYPSADAILAVYGCKGSNISGMAQLIYGETTEDTNACGPNIAAGIEVAFGVYGASGKLPVDIPVYKSETGEIKYPRGYGLTYSKVDPEPEPKPAPALKKAGIKTLRSGSRKLTVTMSAAPAAKGGTYYQVAYKVKGSSVWKYKTTASAKSVIKGLKKGRKYVVKARVYRTTNGSKEYGAWSKTKTSARIK